MDNMKYFFEPLIVTEIEDYIDKLKEGYISVIPDIHILFERFLECFEKRQNEHDNLKYIYSSMLFSIGENEKAMAVLNELIEKNHEPSMFSYGIMLLAGAKVEKNEDQGLNLIEKSAEINYAPALHRKGLFHFNGNYGYEKDLDKALHYALKSAELGYDQGYFLAGRVYTNKEICLENLQKAIMYYEKMNKEYCSDVILKQLGYTYERLGKAYIHGRHGIKIDVTIGNEYLERAADLYEYMRNR